MGPSIKLTNRIILRVENEEKANSVLAMYLRNKEVFEEFEPTRPCNFYTEEFHRAMLHREYLNYQLGHFLRYYIYRTNNLDNIIGAVNFNFYGNGESKYAEVGYKIDRLFQNQGIGYEAVRTGILVMRDDYGFKRIDARIHPNNHASMRLAEKLGFEYLCYEPQSAHIMGRYEDLYRYTLDTSKIQ